MQTPVQCSGPPPGPRPFDAADWQAVLTRYGYPPDFFDDVPDSARPSGPPRQLWLFDIGPPNVRRRTSRNRR